MKHGKTIKRLVKQIDALREENENIWETLDDICGELGVSNADARVIEAIRKLRMGQAFKDPCTVVPDKTPAQPVKVEVKPPTCGDCLHLSFPGMTGYGCHENPASSVTPETPACAGSFEPKT